MQTSTERTWLDSSSKKYQLIAARLKNGTATFSQVVTFFYLNNEQRAELMQCALEGKVIADFYAGTTASKPYRTNLYRTF